MFTAEERSRIRDELVSSARADGAITGAALAGSAARGDEDEWSDIDLLLQLADTADEHATVQRWSTYIAETYGVADSLDVFANGVRYRVFLLNSSLQLDISFWPHDQFRSNGEPLQVVYGTAIATTHAPMPEASQFIGRGWLHALHARSALARGRVWQAVLMLDDLRDCVVALTCLRHELNPWHGRGADLLPPTEVKQLQVSRASRVTADELNRSLILLIDLLISEIEHRDPAKADSLKRALVHT